MRHPYQCIALLSPDLARPDSTRHFIAACGPNLLSLTLRDGSLVSEWSSAKDNTAIASTGDTIENGSEPPAKKQKTTKPVSQASNIIKVVASFDTKHVVAVTDDKVVRVFQVEANGELVELSQRCMPKRPCAIEVLSETSTILCSDKFGDVYSIPLLPVEGENEPSAGDQALPKPIESSFKPSANHLTIHSQRNRQALEAQMKQKNFTPRKEPLKFQHQLLLGHVSMLTDMKVAARVVDGEKRIYIITADRDEHIRISRGPQQAHIIEGYCLGHTEFVSKLCLVPGTDLLVSGGGDTWLGVWNWSQCKLMRKINLGNLLHTLSDPNLDSSEPRLTVSGLWVVSSLAGSDSEQTLVVTCEKVNAMILIPLEALVAREPDASNDDHRNTVFPLPGYPIDLVEIDDTLVISVDDRDDGGKRLLTLRLEKQKSEDSTSKIIVTRSESAVLSNIVEVLNKWSGLPLQEKNLDDLLYNLSNLRKRSGDVDPASAVEAEGEED